MDVTAIIGLVVGIGGVLFGNALEGGHLSSLVQGAAFIIVIMGTAGATILSNKTNDLKRSFSLIGEIFSGKDKEYSDSLKLDLLECARVARKENILALEQTVKGIKDPFLKDLITAICDTSDSQVIQDVFEERIYREEATLLSAAKVWSDAGGFAPTIGIIGAVLGLIHVMGNITDTSKLGGGIAVAFVATIYGVGAANLILIPIGNRLKRVAQDRVKIRMMTLSGGLAIQKGLSPGLIQMRLNSFLEN